DGIGYSHGQHCFVNENEWYRNGKRGEKDDEKNGECSRPIFLVQACAIWWFRQGVQSRSNLLEFFRLHDCCNGSRQCVDDQALCFLGISGATDSAESGEIAAFFRKATHDVQDTV